MVQSYSAASYARCAPM